MPNDRRDYNERPPVPSRPDISERLANQANMTAACIQMGAPEEERGGGARLAADSAGEDARDQARVLDSRRVWTTCTGSRRCTATSARRSSPGY